MERPPDYEHLAGSEPESQGATTASSKESIMRNPFDSLWATIAMGVVLTGILYYAAQALAARAAGV